MSASSAPGPAWLFLLYVNRFGAALAFMMYAGALPVVIGAWGMSSGEAGSIQSAFNICYAVSLWSPEILAADPGLERMNALVTDWMVGIQYFLHRPTPITPGHVAYLGSPWALTSISQAQFWRGDFAQRYGDGSAHDCLSVDISDWDTPGILYGRTAKQCTPEEIAREVWA